MVNLQPETDYNESNHSLCKQSAQKHAISFSM